MSQKRGGVRVISMIVNRGLKEQLFVWVTIVITSNCAAPMAGLAQDAARGWEGSNPDEIAPPVSTVPDKKDAPAAGVNQHGPAGKPVGDDSSAAAPGWNEDSKSSQKSPSSIPVSTQQKAGATEAAATPPISGNSASVVIESGDTALSAGQYAEALDKLDEAWRQALASRPDAKTTALFLERRAIALRGLQRLPEAERHIKQALGHATSGSTKDLELQARLLLELADIQSQEGLPRDGASTARQAIAAQVESKPMIFTVEVLNSEARLLTDIGDVKTAEEKIGEALSKTAGLPQDAGSIVPPQSTISRYSDYLKGKIKVNKYYLKATMGSAGQGKAELDDGLPVIKSYSPGMPPDTRYSPILLQLARDGFSIDSVNAAFEEAGKLPGADNNLIKAELLYQLSLVKENGDDLKGAAEAIKSCHEIRVKALPANSTYIADALIQSSALQLKQGRLADAAAQAQRACSILERSAGRNSLHFARAALALATVYMSSNKFTQLEPILLESSTVFSKIRGKDHPDTLHSLDMLCSTYVRNKKYELAEKYAQRALSGAEKQFGPNSIRLVLSLSNLGTASAHLKKYPEADKYLQRAQNILARSGKTSAPEYADVLACMGVNYTLQKKWPTAASSIKQARSIYVTAYGANSSHAIQMSELLKTMEALKAGPRIPGHNLLLENKFVPRRPDYR